MRRGAIVVGLALLLAGPSALAQSQGQMNDEAAARLKAADRALNQAYAKLVAQASPDGKARLKAAQLAWIKFRDADCDAFAGSRGGSFYPTSLAGCLEGLTRDRARALSEELKCEEGDMGCGGHQED